MTTTAVSISPQGVITEHDLNLTSLTHFAPLIGGGCRYLQPITLGAGELTAWVDEDGISNRQPRNEWAGIVLREFGWSERILGTIIFTGGTDAAGNTLPLTEHDLDAFCDAMVRAAV